MVNRSRRRRPIRPQRLLPISYPEKRPYVRDGEVTPEVGAYLTKALYGDKYIPHSQPPKPSPQTSYKQIVKIFKLTAKLFAPNYSYVRLNSETIYLKINYGSINYTYYKVALPYYAVFDMTENFNAPYKIPPKTMLSLKDFYKYLKRIQRRLNSVGRKYGLTLLQQQELFRLTGAVYQHKYFENVKKTVYAPIPPEAYVPLETLVNVVKYVERDYDMKAFLAAHADTWDTIKNLADAPEEWIYQLLGKE